MLFWDSFLIVIGASAQIAELQEHNNMPVDDPYNIVEQYNVALRGLTLPVIASKEECGHHIGSIRSLYIHGYLLRIRVHLHSYDYVINL